MGIHKDFYHQVKNHILEILGILLLVIAAVKVLIQETGLFK